MLTFPLISSPRTRFLENLGHLTLSYSGQYGLAVTLSAVPVPANPEALQLAKSKGLVTSATEKFFGDDEIVIEIVDDEIEIEGIGSTEELVATIQDSVQETLNRATGKV
ncbi:hypothetical protein [Paenibacillus ginsengihumi]|uniref:hypothetical protein n=1 Tax=Paenibacillus ginsengihumi TaxID=431596 RepID=UPI00035D4A91|nr:hypothetical protein [Paenibacillus ginsengihumi]